jgi:hypothetical protein
MECIQLIHDDYKDRRWLRRQLSEVIFTSVDQNKKYVHGFGSFAGVVRQSSVLTRYFAVVEFCGCLAWVVQTLVRSRGVLTPLMSAMEVPA